MKEENDKKDLENMRDKIQENIKKILNSEFGDELTFEFGDESTSYPPWGHYETLGKVNIDGEWKDIINPFMGRPEWLPKREPQVPHNIKEMFEEMMESSVDQNTEQLVTGVKAWRNLLLAKQIKDGGETFTQETVDAIGLVMGMTNLIKMLKEELE